MAKVTFTIDIEYDEADVQAAHSNEDPWADIECQVEAVVCQTFGPTTDVEMKTDWK